MTTTTRQAPATTGIHHFCVTVSDVEASAEWYARVFGLTRISVTFPHHDDEDGGYAVLLADPHTGLMIGLHHHEARELGAFDERRIGPDHLSWGVSGRGDLDTWTAWLDEIGVAHSGVTDKASPVSYAVVVFRDPDGIQLELVHFPG